METNQVTLLHTDTHTHANMHAMHLVALVERADAPFAPFEIHPRCIPLTHMHPRSDKADT